MLTVDTPFADEKEKRKKNREEKACLDRQLKLTKYHQLLNFSAIIQPNAALTVRIWDD